MVTIIGGKDSTTGDFLQKVPSANCIMQIITGGTTEQYAMVEDMAQKEDYKKELVPVGGTNQQVAGVGAFEGGFTANIVYSTDMPTNWSAVSNGDLAVRTVKIVLTDTQGTPIGKTMTLPLCRIYGHQLSRPKDGVVRRLIDITYLQPATWS